MFAFQMQGRNDGRVLASGTPTPARPGRLPSRRTVTGLDRPADRTLLTFKPIAPTLAACTTSTDPLKEFAMSLIEKLSTLDDRSRSKHRTRTRRHQRPRPRHHLSPVAAEVAPLEQRCMLSGVIPMPITTLTPDQVMYVTQPADAKTVTIHNNSTTDTVYPILQGENTNGALYDTHDPANNEYRVYVGYKGADGYDFGLQPGQSITVPVPQSIWDSGRLNIVEDTPVTQTYFLQSSVPFVYEANALKSVQPINNGTQALLYYRFVPPNGVKAVGVGEDAPSQLVEWTYRDASVTPNDGTSVDYDLSYLDHMYLPVAAEAVPGQSQPQVGYIGTTLNQTDFQSTINKFTSGSLLNGYFGGQGWPQFNLGTTNPGDPIRIPGGYNVDALSPSTSSYNINVPTLSSSQQTSVTPANKNNYAAQAINNLFFSWAEFYQKIWANPGKYKPPGKHIAPTPQLKAFLATGPGSIQAQDGVQTFPIKYTKTPGINDLAHAEAFATNVWKAMWTFSTDTTAVSTAPRFITSTATLKENTNPMFPPGATVLSGVSPSVLDMIKDQVPLHGLSTPVVGPGIPQRDNIYKFDGNDIVLLQPSTGTVGKSETYRFYFYPPNAVTQPEIQATSQLIGAVLGDSIGDLKTLGGNNWMGQPWSSDAVRQAFTENVVKPLLYGVTTPAQESDANIPAPGNPQTDIAAQYNLDPLVWLVHTAANWPNNQRIYAYAFSVDDAYGNVMIGNSSGIQVSVGGPAGLTDTNPYVKPA